MQTNSHSQGSSGVHCEQSHAGIPNQVPGASEGEARRSIRGSGEKSCRGNVQGAEKVNLIERAEQVKAYIEANPYCSRSEIVRAIGIGRETLKKLEEFVKLPPKMNNSIGATKGRKMRIKAKTEKNFRVSR